MRTFFRKLRKGAMIGIAGIIILHIFDVAYTNMQLRKHFVLVDHNISYEDSINNKDLNAILANCGFTEASSLIGFEYVKTIKSPKEIAYYQNINDKEASFIIHKGEIICIKLEMFDGASDSFRGLMTLPTTQRGWRLAKPFEMEDGRKSASLYYVKLSDIRTIAREWLSVNPGIKKSLTSVVRGGWGNNKYADYLILRVDKLLYRNGSYLSPDLFQSVLSLSFIILLCMLLFEGRVYLQSVISNSK